MTDQEWSSEHGVMVPSSANDLAKMVKGQWVCSGSMEEGRLVRQPPHPLLPDAPRHMIREAPTHAPCGSKRFVLAYYHEDRHLYVRCDECGAPQAIVMVED
jgi:hypothetical protein